LEFYGFDFSVVFAYSIGGYCYDDAYQSFFTGFDATVMANGHKDILNSWTPTNTNTTLPRLSNDPTALLNNYQASTQWLIDASYLKLQNLTLGYTLPAKWLEKMKMSNFRAFVTLDNFWMISRRKGLDPSHSLNGTYGNATYYPVKTVSFGLNVSF
jgi:hypothetical protein